MHPSGRPVMVRQQQQQLFGIRLLFSVDRNSNAAASHHQQNGNCVVYK
jgi:hypothetical protein